jgi:hypothetical protein
LAKRIVQTQIRPIVADALAKPGKYSSKARALVVNASPVLWACHPASTLDYISRLDIDGQHEAISNIVSYVLTGELPEEPWEQPRGRRIALKDDQVTDALELLEKMNADVFVYAHLDTMLKSFRDRKATAAINQNQRAHFLSRIETIAREKFPDALRIKHEGYLLLTEAALLSARGASDPDWRKLLERVDRIPNLSDQCFLAALFIELIPSKFSVLKRQCFERSAALIARLPTYADRLLRASTLLEECSEQFRKETRQIVEVVVKDSYGDTNSRVDKRREKLIELAYRQSEEWAASLASAIDDDPVRIEVNLRNQRRMKELGIQKKLGARSCDLQEVTDVQALSSACSRELAFMNATGVTLRTNSDVIDLIEKATQGSLESAISTMSFGIEALCVRYSDTAEAVEFIRPMFDGLIEAGELIRDIAERELDDKQFASTIDSNSIGNADNCEINAVIAPGQREFAVELVKRWLNSINGDELSIVDPYFSPNDLDALLLIQRERPLMRLRILTARKNSMELIGQGSFTVAFTEAWERLSTSQPPETSICVAGLKSDGSLPIHDRWWVSGDACLEFGTSWNGLGIKKASVVRSGGNTEATSRLMEMEPYLSGTKRSVDGERIVYSIFTLGESI